MVGSGFPTSAHLNETQLHMLKVLIFVKLTVLLIRFFIFKSRQQSFLQSFFPLMRE